MSSVPPPPPATSGNTLEIEDDDERQRRLQSLLEKLNTGSSSSTSSGPAKYDFGDRTTHPVDPPSELLSRVQAFLPQIEASNVTLAQQVEVDPQSVDIENVDSNAERYIEMNLGLGLFEVRPDNSSQAEEGDADETRSSSTDSLDSSGSEDGDEDEDEDGDGDEDDDEDEDDSESGSDGTSNSDSTGSSDLDSDSESSSDEIWAASNSSRAPRPIKPLPRRAIARPLIEVIGDNPPPSQSS